MNSRCPISIIALVLTGLVHSEERALETFHVSQVGADKSELNSAFERVRTIEQARDQRQSSFKVLQRLSPKRYLVSKTTDRFSIYCLDTLNPQNTVDGDTISIATAETTGVFEYTAVSGAKKSVQILEEIVKREFTQAEFVGRLKQGQSWVLKSFRLKQCPVCLGSGNLGSIKRFARCKRCEGKGKAAVDCRVLW